MASVELFGLNKVVKFDEDETFSMTLDNGDTYEECAWTKGAYHHLIAYDPAINAWVQLK